MAEKGTVCETCGTLLIEYKFGLNKGLLGFLKELAREGRACHLDELNLTKGQYTNHALVAHWGLAEMMAPVNALEERKGGKWRLTRLGVLFLRGGTAVPKHVYTLQGKVTRIEGPNVAVRDIDDGYWYRGDYREYAREQIEMGL